MDRPNQSQWSVLQCSQPQCTLFSVCLYPYPHFLSVSIFILIICLSPSLSLFSLPSFCVAWMSVLHSNTMSTSSHILFTFTIDFNITVCSPIFMVDVNITCWRQIKIYHYWRQINVSCQIILENLSILEYWYLRIWCMCKGEKKKRREGWFDVTFLFEWG